MSGILLKNGFVMDSQQEKLIKKDILVKGNRVERIDTTIPPDNDMVLDVEGMIVSPGFIDMHVHLRDPGFTEKETIETGTLAAARGGFTTIASMPNTRPITDSKETVEYILKEAKRVGKARVLPIAAITHRELGNQLTEMDLLKEAGVIGFSDDGVGVQSSKMMREAMKKAKDLNLPIIAHCEDHPLVKGGCVHEGKFSRLQGLIGLPSEAESIQVSRDILLQEHIGTHYHVCHISTKESVRLVREAKLRGQKVTAEVTPHHLLLCEEDIPGPDPMYKMNPPLRTKEDQKALIEGLLDGTIDIIATDHAPHTCEEKQLGMKKAPFGIVGLEIAFPLLYTHLVDKGIMTLYELLDKLTGKPREIFNLPYGLLKEGEFADITILNLTKEQKIDPDCFLSKGNNTPFRGWAVKGWPVLTMMDGVITWEEC